MCTFLVTGGAGFIGSHIAATLVERGDRVRVLDNFTPARGEHGRVPRPDRVHQGGRYRRRLAAGAVDGVDCVFHEAALASVPASVERPLASHAACVHRDGDLLDAARRAGVRRLVYAATSAAYGDQPTSSKRETDLPAPISPYAAAKLAARIVLPGVLVYVWV